jgi:hypothetical protein
MDRLSETADAHRPRRLAPDQAGWRLAWSQAAALDPQAVIPFLAASIDWLAEHADPAADVTTSLPDLLVCPKEWDR